MKDEKKIKTNVIPIKQHEETEFQEFKKRMEDFWIDHEKRMKKMKVLLSFLIVYLVTIVIASAIGIFVPKLQVITDLYLMLCNLASVGLCIWSLISFYKNKMHKDKQVKWLSFVIFGGIIMNILVLIFNLMEYIK